MSRREPEVLVVGAGPVGQVAALALARRGARVEIIDEATQVGARSYALALHPRSLEILDDLGLAADLVPRGHRVDSVAFYDREKRLAAVRYADVPSRFPFLLILPQAELEAALEKALRDAHLRVEWNHRLAQLDEQGDRVVARVEQLGRETAGYSVQETVWAVEKELEFKAKAVLGADGHRSVVRRRLGLGFPEAGPSSLYAVYEFLGTRECEHEVRVVLDGDTTSVLWPMGGARYRWNLELTGPQAPETRRRKSTVMVVLGDQSYAYLEPALLEKLVAERAPWFEERPREILWSMALRFERRLATELARGRVALAGDAAHLGGPIAMQSMNAGLAEAAAFAERAAAAVREGGVAEALQAWGHEHATRWKRLPVGGDVVAGPTAAPEVKVRAQAIAAGIPASGPQLAALLQQLGLGLPA